MSQQNYEYLDVVSRLVSNYRQDKPLLDGAVLFRGSRFGDQAPAKDTPEQLHGHLLPQIAASYTHSWKKTDAFIDTYPLDREKTRFFASPSMDEHLKGNQAKSYSVQDVERAITPLVENLAYHPKGSKAWVTNVESLEKVIKSSFYEAAVPVRTADGARTQPQEKFFYSGGPKVSSAADVLANLERMTPANEARAKAIYAMSRPTETAKAIAQVETLHPEAAKAFKVMQQAVQRDQAKGMLTLHGAKPLTEFIDQVRKEPQTEAQSRVLRLAQGLGHSLDSTDPNVRARALGVTAKIAALDPATVTIRDIGQAISNVNAASSGTSAGSRAPAEPTRAPPSRAPVAAFAGMAR
jgi:hypothetical protein